MKKTWMKKALCGMLAGVMMLSATACSGGGSETASTTAAGGEAQGGAAPAAPAASGDQKVIKFMHRFPDEPYNSFIEGKLHEYEASHPDIKFEITSAQNQEYKEKIKIVVGGDDTPDIFFSWVGDFTERFIREGLILDLGPYLEADPEWKDSLIESQMEQYTNKDGMVYGIPFRLDCKLFFYNKKMFDDNGLQAPKTWDELIAACETLKAAGMLAWNVVTMIQGLI